MAGGAVTPEAAPSVPKMAPFRIVHPVRKERWLNMCIYGDFGSGKTHLAATAQDVPEMCDVLFVDVESGDLTLTGRPNLDVVQINDYSQMARIFEFLKVHCQARDANDEEKLRKLDQAIHEGERKPPRYKTLIVDSLSELATVCMYGLQGVRAGVQKLDQIPDQPGYGEWGKQKDQISLLIRFLRDLPMNIILICSDKGRDEEAKKDKIGPNLPKSLARNLPGYLDVFGYLKTTTIRGDRGQVKIERQLCLNPGDFYFAKNRFVGFADHSIDDPTMAKCIQLVKYDYK